MTSDAVPVAAKSMSEIRMSTPRRRPHNPQFILLLGLALWSCHVVVPAGASRKANGQPCGSADECDVACVDGVCCAQACAATQTCNTPGALGQCVDRLAGAACTADAECPSGHCADHVCCNTACAEPCSTCADTPGVCTPARDNTDARNDCGGPCNACFSHVCAPARFFTNPKANVTGAGCGLNMVCSAVGECGLVNGEACDDGGEPCASGICAGRLCLGGSQEFVRDPQSNPRAQVNQLMDTAMLPDGTPCLLVRADEYDPFPDISRFYLARRDLNVVCRDNAGWLGRNVTQFDDRDTLPDGTYLRPATQVAETFRHRLELAASPTGPVLLGGDGVDSVLGERLGVEGCTLWARWYYRGLTVGGTRCLTRDAGLEAGARTSWVSADSAPDGTLWIASSMFLPGSGAQQLYLFECTSEQCLPPKVLSTQAASGWPGVLLLGESRPLVFHVTTGVDQVEALDGTRSATLDVGLQSRCALVQNADRAGYNADHPGTAIRVAPFPGTNRWSVAVVCRDSVGLVEFDADSFAFSDWTILSAPDVLAAYPVVGPAGVGVLTVTPNNVAVRWMDGGTQNMRTLVEDRGFRVETTMSGVEQPAGRGLELYWTAQSTLFVDLASGMTNVPWLKSDIHRLGDPL